ncbi:putative ribonuclease H-like domain-containing protein [Tanacetum coccineum]
MTKKKLECFNCHNTSHFARECTAKGTYDGKKKRDSPYQHQEAGKKEENQMGLLTMDDGIVNWGEHTEAEETNHALMAISSSNEVSSGLTTCIDSYNKLKLLYDEQMNQLGDQEAQILALAMTIHEKRKKLKRYRRIGMKAVKEKEQLQKTVDSWKDSSKNLWRLINSGMSSNDKLGLGFEIQSNDEVLSYEEEMNFSVFKCSKEDSIGKPSYSRFTKTNDFKGVPHPLSGDYTPKPQEEIDDSLYVYGKKGPQKPEISVSDDNSSEHSTCQSNTRTNINSGRPKVNPVSPKVNTVRSKQPGSAVKTSAGYNWRNSKPHSNYDSGSTFFRTDHPLKNMVDRGIFDSGCSRHMTGNKDQLEDFEEFNEGSVTFGELGHFNLLSISQMCDKQHKVLFTETECLVVSSDFKMHDENQILLKVPRQHNMYSFDMKTPGPAKSFACLIAKATSDESKLWHRRLGHINFKNLNKLVKGNLVRGLPSKVFKNDHTCVACQKGKQHRASCKAKLERMITEPLHTLHMDLFGPTSVKSINHASYCLVITDDCTRFSWVFFLATKDETSGILQNFIRQIENQLNHRVKIIRSDNGTEFKNRNMLEFCGNKGIKQEYSNARTPQQNGVAERMNKTLIEAVRTMLADSLLPTMFWIEAVNTACYIFNRVRVTKPQNKTSYELLFGHKPIISYIRPFRCHVTILDTLSVLGKFDGKCDEGFLVEKPNVKGVGYRWMFDIDYLTDSMYYIPVSLENQTNPHAGTLKVNNSACTLQTPNENDYEKEDEELIVVPTAVKHTAAKVGPRFNFLVVNIVPLPPTSLNHAPTESTTIPPKHLISSARSKGRNAMGNAIVKVGEEMQIYGGTDISISELDEADISPQGLEAAETLAEVLSQIKTKRRNVKTGVRRRLDAEDVSTGFEDVSTGFTDIKSASEKVSSGGEHVSASQREGKAVLEETPQTKRTKKQIREEQASLAEIARIQAEDEAENARREELKRQDELAAKRLQEELELSEAQKKRMAQVQEAAQFYTEEDWDTIRAKLEANADLVKEIAGEDVSEADYAQRMVGLISQRRKLIAEQKAKAQRDKPMTQAQQRQYMATYLKNQGGWKLAQIKKLTDEELKEKFEYLMRSMERFVPMDTEKESRKRTGVELQTESSKKLKSDTREDVSVPKEKDKESVKREEEFEIKKPVLRYTKRKSLARKGLQKKPESAKSGTEEDVEAYMEERVDEPSSEEFPMSSIPQGPAPAKIVKWQIIKTGKRGAYQIIREDNTDVITGLKKNLKGFYGGDLKTMFDPPSEEDAIWKLPHQQQILNWRYFHSCSVHCLTVEAAHIYMLTEVKYPLPPRVCKAMLEKKLLGDRKDESTTSNRHKDWLVKEQTALGKDFSNPFIADNLPKTGWYSTYQ